MDDDEFDDVADVFESSYNFRFEEPYVTFCSFALAQVSHSCLFPQGRSRDRAISPKYRLSRSSTGHNPQGGP